MALVVSKNVIFRLRKSGKRSNKMKSISFSRAIWHGLLGTGALCLAFSLTAAAQVQSTTKTTPDGAATRSIKVERGEVVYVSGNSCVIKAEDGTLRHFDNVPESVTVTVDGKQLNIHQIQPGMKIERQTITTTTPKVITTIKTVTGTVWHVQPPNSVILTMENGKNQSFKIPKGQKFTVDGQQTDAFGLKKGMKVDAQQVIEQPADVVAREVRRSGTMPPPPPAPKADVPILVLVAPAAAPAPVETAAAEPAPTKLPKTASDLPLIGLLGLLCCVISIAAMTIRFTISRFGVPKT
jgi:RNase P/RNase MRP subunit p29